MTDRGIPELQRELKSEKSTAKRQLLLKEIWVLKIRPKPEGTDKQPPEPVTTLDRSRTVEAPAKASEGAPSATAV